MDSESETGEAPDIEETGSMAVHKNTSPTFPARPEHGMRGIETMRTSDNMA